MVPTAPRANDGTLKHSAAFHLTSGLVGVFNGAKQSCGSYFVNPRAKFCELGEKAACLHRIAGGYA